MAELLIHPGLRRQVARGAGTPRHLPPDRDGIAPARGVVLALLLSALFWAALAVVVRLSW